MKLEDIKKETPKTPEMIHNRIQDEIKKQMENEQIAVFPTQNAKKTKEPVWQQSPQFVF